MGGDRLGDLAHQRAQFAHLGGERIDRNARPLDRLVDLGFHGVEPARDLAHLAREIGGAAREVGDLVAEGAAVGEAAADRVVEHHGHQGAERDEAGAAHVQLEGEIEHGADRGGDEHHADRDEDGADTNHAVIPGRPPPGGRLIRSAGPQCPRPRLSAQPRTPAMVTRIRPYRQEVEAAWNVPGWLEPGAPAFAAAARSGLIARITAYPGRTLAAVLALHAAVWTALPALLYPNLPLDLIEALMYGREWQLGYDKLPPLPWWLVEDRVPADRARLRLLPAGRIGGDRRAGAGLRGGAAAGRPARRAGVGADRRRPALLQLHRRQVQSRRHPAAVLGARRLFVPPRAAPAAADGLAAARAWRSACRCGRNISWWCWRRRWSCSRSSTATRAKCSPRPGPISRPRSR